MVQPQTFDVPIVKRAMVLEFQSANAVRDPFETVTLAVRPIIRRIDAPLVARAVVTDLANTIHRRIAKIHIGRVHIDLGS